MRVDNLVFNKIGNSLSVMVFHREGGLQLYDETDFVYNGYVLDLYGICLKDSLNFYFKVIKDAELIQCSLNLNENNSSFSINNNKFDIHIKDEFLEIILNDPNLSFKSSFYNFKILKSKGEILEVPEKNFLKGFVEFINFVKLK